MDIKFAYKNIFNMNVLNTILILKNNSDSGSLNFFIAMALL